MAKHHHFTDLQALQHLLGQGEGQGERERGGERERKKEREKEREREGRQKVIMYSTCTCGMFCYHM